MGGLHLVLARLKSSRIQPMPTREAPIWRSPHPAATPQFPALSRFLDIREKPSPMLDGPITKPRTRTPVGRFKSLDQTELSPLIQPTTLRRVLGSTRRVRSLFLVGSKDHTQFS